MTVSESETLNRRDLALLTAVGNERCEIVPGSQPVMFVDGHRFCDVDAARRLVRAGLVAQPGLGSGRWPARLTEAGQEELARARHPSRRAS